MSARRLILGLLLFSATSCGAEAYYGPWPLDLPPAGGGTEAVQLVRLPLVRQGYGQGIRIDVALEGQPGTRGGLTLTVAEPKGLAPIATRLLALGPGEKAVLVINEADIAQGAADPRRGPNAGQPLDTLRVSLTPALDGMTVSGSFTVRVAER